MEKYETILLRDRSLVLKEILGLQFNPRADNYESEAQRYRVLKEELSFIDSTLLQIQKTMTCESPN